MKFLQVHIANTYVHTYVPTSSVRISKFTFSTRYVNLKHTVFHSNFTSLTWQVQLIVLMYTCSILIEHNITAGQLQLCQYL